ncbi:MAG TPA: zinc ribbon domain-containing protein [Candidatus Eisenbacteria bacterium]|nr:zinc ribbon domain-containing protein [Candidatus Eisenbacteria bacterium]
MPVYEYRCVDCRRVWDALLDRWDSPAPACPQCGAAGERLLSTFAVGAAAGGPRSSGAPGPCGSPDCACRTHS